MYARGESASSINSSTYRSEGTARELVGLLIVWGDASGYTSVTLSLPADLSVMSQSSEDRLQDAAAQSELASAQILPFERPPNDLQRAVQLRAQEALDRDRDRSKRRPAPLRWAIIFLLALVPVVLLFAAVDAFVRAFQHINEMYSTMPAPTPAEGAQPPVEVSEPSAPQPGVVILQSLPKQDAPSSPAEDDSTS